MSKAIIVKVPERHIILIGDKVLYARTAFHAGDVARAYGATEVEEGDHECLNITYGSASEQPSSSGSATAKTKRKVKSSGSRTQRSYGRGSGGSSSKKASAKS